MSEQRWALYAKTYRRGTWNEHRLAGARVGTVGVVLDYSLPEGWRGTLHVGRFALKASVGHHRDDWRLRAYFEHIMPPPVRDKLAQSMTEIDSGRGYSWDPRGDGRDPPLATWRPDDPDQPDGWHHDGSRWVLNDMGWAKDRYGEWRYTHPGDPGWQENRDGSWRYIKADGTDDE